MANNIVLIGMPAVGKSTAGVILAKVLGYQFVDVDLEIQKQEKRLLKDIIAQDGIDGFIKVENRVNSELDIDNAVISTGGSVVYGQEAMEHLREIGTVVYLKLPYRVISRRLNNIEGRGVVLREGQTLKKLYDERVPLYEKYAHITVDETGLNIEKTVLRIIEEINKCQKN